MRVPDRRHQGLLSVCLAGTLWGTGGLAVQLVRRHAPLPPLVVSGYRTAVAAAVLVAVVLAARRGAELADLLRRRPALVAAAGLATGGYQGLYFLAVVLGGVSVPTVVSLGTAPVLLALLDLARTRRDPVRRLAPVATALAGLALVAGAGGTSTGTSPAAGTAVALVAGACYALATALGGRLARGERALPVTAATTLVGACALVPAALATGGPVLTADPAALAVLGYLGAVSFALAYGLLYAGLAVVPAAAAVLATLMEPVTAALLAAAVLGESLGVRGVAGVVLVLGAVAVPALRPGPAPGTPPPGPPRPARRPPGRPRPAPAGRRR